MSCSKEIVSNVAAYNLISDAVRCRIKRSVGASPMFYVRNLPLSCRAESPSSDITKESCIA